MGYTEGISILLGLRQKIRDEIPDENLCAVSKLKADCRIQMGWKILPNTAFLRDDALIRRPQDHRDREILPAAASSCKAPLTTVRACSLIVSREGLSNLQDQQVQRVAGIGRQETDTENRFTFQNRRNLKAGKTRYVNSTFFLPDTERRTSAVKTRKHFLLYGRNSVRRRQRSLFRKQ